MSKILKSTGDPSSDIQVAIWDQYGCPNTSGSPLLSSAQRWQVLAFPYSLRCIDTIDPTIRVRVP